MRTIAPAHFAAWVVLAALPWSFCWSQIVDSTAARKRAVELYPELGRLGSPLNRKFLELYNRAKAANSPILLEADWPIILAKSASTELALPAPAPAKGSPPKESPFEESRAGSRPEIKTEAMRFKVPTGDPPEFDPDQPNGGKWNIKEIELQAQVIPRASRLIPDNFPPGDRPDVWRTLAQFRRAARGTTIEAVRQMYMPEAWARVIPQQTTAGAGDAEILQYMSMLADAKVPVVVETDGRMIPILDAGNRVVKSLPMQKSGNEYLLDEPTDISPATAAALDELVRALWIFRVEELVVK